MFTIIRDLAVRAVRAVRAVPVEAAPVEPEAQPVIMMADTARPVEPAA